MCQFATRTIGMMLLMKKTLLSAAWQFPKHKKSYLLPLLKELTNTACQLMKKAVVGKVRED